MKYAKLNGARGLLAAVLASAIADANNHATPPTEKTAAKVWLAGGDAPLTYKHILESLGLDPSLKPQVDTL